MELMVNKAVTNYNGQLQTDVVTERIALLRPITSDK
jgi:hypothetical protein